MWRAPLLPVALALTAGILLQGYAGSFWWALLPIGAGVIASLSGHVFTGLMSFTLATGFLLSAVATPVTPLFLDNPDGCDGVWSGVVTEYREADGVTVCVVRIDSAGSVECEPFLSKCLIPGLTADVNECCRIRFHARIHRLTSDTDLPDETDFNLRLRRSGVVAQSFIPPDSILDARAEDGVFNDVRRSRVALQRRISSLPMKPATQSFLIATLTGDRSLLEPSLSEMFRTSGIAHILALSGLHVAILTGVLYVLLFPLTAAGFPKTRMLVTLTALWLFAILTGMTPSVVRSVIMASIFIVTLLMQRVWSPVNAIGAAAVIILVCDPLAVHSVGFQLSFIAVISIVALADVINPVPSRSPYLRRAFGMITVTIAAVAGTAMVSACHFHNFPLWFLVSNVCVTPVLPLLLGSGVLLLLLSFAGLDFTLAARLTDHLYQWIENVVTFTDSLSGGSGIRMWIEPEIAVAWSVTLIALAVALHSRRRVWIYATCALGVFTLLCGLLIKAPACRHEIYITRSRSETTMILREGPQLFSVTTARGSGVSDVMSRDSMRYDGYMLRRGISSFRTLAENEAFGSIQRSGNVVSAAGRSFILVSHDSHCHDYGFRPDYVVVCRGYKGDIASLTRTVSADSVLLSADLNMRRHNRYASTLATEGIPFRSLRSAPFVLAE